jgi:prepilin-type N-terminal cleavage/methylation domain-containing protein
MLRNNRRRGFTLIELLVAIGLALVVLGVVAAVSQSSLTDSYKVTGAGDRLSQYLMTARNRAIRDKAPRGVRIINDEAGRPSGVQYTEAPEAWLPASDHYLHVYYPSNDGTTLPTNPPATGAAAPNNIRILLSGTSNTMLADFQASVQVGDLLSVPELGWAYRIQTIMAPTPAAQPLPVPAFPTGSLMRVELRLTAYPNLGAGYSDSAAFQPRTAICTRQFGIFRQARDLLGEPTQSLATGMFIDTTNSLNYQSDILFAPTGEIMNNNGAVMSFLLRDYSYRGSPAVGTTLDATNTATSGEIILVAIYPRTGTVATKGIAPLSASNTDLHRFAKDGINSGL